MRRHHHLLPTHIYTILIRCNEIKGSKNISTLKMALLHKSLLSKR